MSDPLAALLHEDPALCRKRSPNGHTRWMQRPLCVSVAARLRERSVTLTQPQPAGGLREAIEAALNYDHDLGCYWLNTPPAPCSCWQAPLLAALRSTPAAPTHTPKVMEAEAGRLLVESARIRAARLGPDDAHELRHLWAAINAGNSDPCGETCHLDADAIARWTEQYPKVMGLVALRSTPTARKPDARSLADRITGVIAIPPDGEVEP